MKSTTRWFLLSLGVLAVLLTGLSQKGTAYEYTAWTESNEDASFTPEDQTSTHWEDATASGDADESTGTCSCYVHTWAWAKEDSASATAHAQYTYGKHWVWNGPPGTAPGGTLSWSLDGQGFEWARGEVRLKAAPHTRPAMWKVIRGPSLSVPPTFTIVWGIPVEK